MLFPPHGQVLPRPHTWKIFLIHPDRIGLKIEFNKATVERLNSIPGHQWDGVKAIWTFPKSRDCLYQLLAALRTDWRALDREIIEAFHLTDPLRPPAPPPTAVH